jgi:hypothetical protein
VTVTGQILMAVYRRYARYRQIEQDRNPGLPATDAQPRGFPKLPDTDGSAAECQKILARYADDPSTMLAACEREAIGVARAVLARVVDEEFNAR